MISSSLSLVPIYARLIVTLTGSRRSVGGAVGECKVRQGGELHPALRRRHAHEVLVVVELDRDKTALSIHVGDGAVRRQAPERLLLDLGAD